MFFRDQKGFVVIAGALFLPFVFGLCAIAFDLGVGLSHQARLSDVLIESSLMTSSTLEDRDIVMDRIKTLGKSYLGKQELKNIQIKDNDSSSQNRNNLISVQAMIEYRGIFGKFLDIEKNNQNMKVDSYAKYEGLQGDLGATDYVFSIAFTGSSTQNSSLNSSTAKKICSSGKSQIVKGFCNPPLGEPKAIDAVQSMVAYTISLAKSFDKDNSQYFGFIPYGGGSQVKGKDLGEEANIDFNDGLNQQERNNATYVVWPIQIFSPPSFKDYDIYSRFYPKEVLDQSNSLLREKVIKRLNELRVDTTLLTHLDLSEYLLSRFELNQENPLLKQNSIANFNQAKEALELIFNTQAVGEENGLVNNPSNVARTIENLFNQKQSIIYRLYNKNIDKITLTKGRDELIEASREIKVAQSSLNSILADINILRKLREKAGYVENADATSPLDKISKVDDLYNFIYDQMKSNSDAYDSHEGKYCLTSDGYHDCETKIGELESEKKDPKKIIEELHLKDLATGGMQQTVKVGELLKANQELFLPQSDKDLIREVENLRSEIRRLKSDGIYNLCSNINRFTESYVIEACNTSFKSSFDKVVQQLQEKEAKLKVSEPKYLEAVQKKQALDRLINQTASLNDPDTLLAKLEVEKNALQEKIKAYEESLRDGIEIKGKALCNSFATFINGSSCQSMSAGGLKFHEINLRKIRNNDAIKEIDLLNQDPFEIDKRFGTYITGVGQEHDYASIGLIRSALMLSKSQTQNPNAKIIVFSTTANQNDEALFKAGLCQAIRDGISMRTGAEVEIYAIALGLPTDEQREVNQEKYKKIWRSCTKEKNILLGDNIDSLLERISQSVFKGGGGKVTFDSLR